jgi:hypothetical protein
MVSREEINDSFFKLPLNLQEMVLYIVSHFHYRDGVKHEDGSLGMVRITNKQMNDCIATGILLAMKGE